MEISGGIDADAVFDLIKYRVNFPKIPFILTKIFSDRMFQIIVKFFFRNIFSCYNYFISNRFIFTPVFRAFTCNRSQFRSISFPG